MNAHFTRSFLTMATAAATLFTAGTAMAQTKSDFNADGKADLVWRKSSADQTVLWYMNGASYTSVASFAPTGSVNNDVGGVGDVNGDGHPDLVLRNKVNGSHSVWFTGVGTSVFHTTILQTLADLNWKIAGLGDFNFDGRDDIVWRNYRTGENMYWTTKNWSDYDKTVALPGSGDLNWYLGGVGDFDNNGYPDLVWHNTSTGANGIWMMSGTNGTTIASVKGLDSSAAALRPDAVADYTGDGCIDIVMRHATTGAAELWAYDCNINRVSVTPIGTVDTGWQISVH